MSKYVIISKSRHDHLLKKIFEIADKSSASKRDVANIQIIINRINHASFIKEAQDEELINALNKYNGGESNEI